MEAEKYEAWYEAISRRHSRRKYAEEPVEEEKLDALALLIEELNGSHAEYAGAALVREHSGFRGVISGAPSYIAFILRSDFMEAYEHLGYLGEAVVLEATRLGLGSCWVSGTFDSKAVAAEISLDEGWKVFAVTPIGYPKEKKAWSEKLMGGLAGSHRRKSIEQLVLEEGHATPVRRSSGSLTWPAWARTAVEAARLAPSALNRQPWLFRFEEGELLIELAGNPGSVWGGLSKRLDCGIALCHLYLGAVHELGVTPRLVFYREETRIAGLASESTY